MEKVRERDSFICLKGDAVARSHVIIIFIRKLFNEKNTFELEYEDKSFRWGAARIYLYLKSHLNFLAECHVSHLIALITEAAKNMSIIIPPQHSRL